MVQSHDGMQQQRPVTNETVKLLFQTPAEQFEWSIVQTLEEYGCPIGNGCVDIIHGRDEETKSVGQDRL